MKNFINPYDYLFHGIRPPYDENGENHELDILRSILKQKAILSRNEQEKQSSYIRLNDNLNRNGLDNVSVCEKCSKTVAIFI